MIVANLPWLNVSWPDAWPLTPHPQITNQFQPEPVFSRLFCNSKASYWAIVAKSDFTWSAEQRLGWRTGWTRGFLFHFLYEGPVKWLFVRVLACVSQENATSMAVVSAQDVQSLLRTVVTLWIMQRSHTHTGISMDIAHIETCVCKSRTLRVRAPSCSLTHTLF